MEREVAHVNELLTHSPLICPHFTVEASNKILEPVDIY